MRPLAAAVTASLIAAVGLVAAPSASAAPTTKPKATAATAAKVSKAAAAKTPLEAADVRSAELTARVRGVRVEALSERAEDSKTWANPDGSFTSESSTGPVRMRDAAAKSGWVDLDPTLVRQADGSVTAKAHPEFLKLSGPVTSASGTASLISQVDPGDALASSVKTRSRARTMSWGWPGKLPVPVLDGTKATYPDVRPGMDLVVEATTTGFEQFLVVKVRPSNPADVIVTLPVAGRGLNLASDGKGGATIKNAKGVTRGRVPAPVMWDSQRVAKAVPSNRKGVPMTVTQTKAGHANVTMTPDAAFLMNPATQYPVTIDPSATLSPSFDTFVQTSNFVGTTEDLSAATQLFAGTANGGANLNRSFLSFPMAFKGAVVTAATMNLYQTVAQTCTPMATDVYASAGANALTRWANQPAIKTTLLTRVAASKGMTGCAAGTVSFNVQAQAQDSANSTATVSSYSIRASETNTAAFKVFASSQAAIGRPSLSVTYNRYPNTAGTPTHTPGTSSATTTPGVTTTTTPTLSATVSDPDGGPVTGMFSVWLDGAGTPVIDGMAGSTVTSGGISTLVVPAGRLVNGSRYMVWSYGYDGTLVSKAWSVGYDNFTVDTTGPAVVPTISSTTFPQDTWSTGVDSAGKAHFDINAGTADSTKLQWYLGGNPAWGNTATVTGTTPTIDAAIDMTFLGQGEFFLYARSLDLAGNASATKTYRFIYGNGAALAEPATNQVTSGRVPLRMQIDASLSAGLGQPEYQYRRGDADPWKPIPATDVHTATGFTVTGLWPAAADSVSEYVWDAPTTLGGGGTIDVRVFFHGNNAVTAPRTVTVDVNAGAAGTSTAGPGSVNLSTGQLSLAATDAHWFGVGIGRVYGSRSLVAGTSDGQAAAFGPQWSSGAIGGNSSYTMVAKTSSTSLDLLQDGARTSFTLKSGTSGSTATWVPQPGAEELKMVGDPAGTAGSVFTLTKIDRSVTTFRKPTGGPVNDWPLYSTTSSGGGNAARYGSVVDASGKLRLAVIAAPNPSLTPAGLDACVTIPVPTTGPAARGCRVLVLTWGTVNTDTGAQSRVTGIDAWATDPATSAMTSTTLAGFGYDAHGWLTSATDSIKNLVTEYGYDAAGLLTSLTPDHAPSAPTARLPWTFGYAGAGVTAGPVWDRITPTSSGRLVTVSRAALTPGSLTTTNGTATTNVVYGVPVSKAGHGPADVSAANTASWGQNDPAFEGTAVFDTDAQPGSSTDFWAGDDTVTRSWAAAQVTFIDANGHEVNHLGRDGGLDAASFDTAGNQVFALTAGNRAIATGDAPGAGPLGLAGQPSTVIGQQLATVSGYQPGTVTTVGEQAPQRLAYTAGPLHTVVTAAGAQALERAVTRNTYDQGRPASIVGSTVPPIADVVTSMITGGAAYGAEPAVAVLDDPRTTTSTYDWALGGTPVVTVDPSAAVGDEIITRTAFDSQGREISKTMPGGTQAGTTVSTYYDSATAAPCTGHPEWGGMVCNKAAQGPISSGANPQLISTTATYTRTGAPAKNVETANGINRTTTMTYDTAERPTRVSLEATTTTGSVTTALGTEVAAQTFVYDPATGDETGFSATIAGVTQTVSSTTDALGRQVSTIDGTGLAGSTQFDILDRATKITQTDTANTLPAGGRRTYATTSSYDATTGRLTSTTDDQAGTTSLGYNIDGAITSQAVVTGSGTLTMTQTGDPTGKPVSRQWRLAGAAAPVVSEQVVGNIHGQWIDHSTTAGTTRRYAYDGASRLASVTNLASNATCIARSYSYNTNSDRLGEGLTASAAAGATSATNPTGCATPTKPATTHTFDSADRLTDSGYTYDAFGRTTRLPLGGATGASLSGQVMRVGYNVNDLVATQQVYANAADADAASGAGQNPIATQTYTLDATGQRLQTFTKTGTDAGTGLPVTTTKTNRYASTSDSPDWIYEGSSGPAANTLTRNISGPSGGLLATTRNPEAGGPGSLNWQLTSLHGDVAVSLPNDVSTAVQAMPLADEYGVPDPTDSGTRGADNRYGWLGGLQRSTEAPGGVTLMGLRLYNPTTGRFLSIDPVTGGNANAYTYPTDPVNSSDPTGAWSWTRTYTKQHWSYGTWAWHTFANMYRVTTTLWLSHQDTANVSFYGGIVGLLWAIAGLVIAVLAAIVTFGVGAIVTSVIFAVIGVYIAAISTAAAIADRFGKRLKLSIGVALFQQYTTSFGWRVGPHFRVPFTWGISMWYW